METNKTQEASSNGDGDSVGVVVTTTPDLPEANVVVKPDPDPGITHEKMMDPANKDLGLQHEGETGQIIFPSPPLPDQCLLNGSATHLNNNLQRIHVKQWTTSVDKLVEFRFDILNFASLHRNEFVTDDSKPIVFNPRVGNVFTVIESVVHYFNQPVCQFLNGQWFVSHLPIPVAQHICVSLDNGTKRYEEVIRMDSVKFIGSPDTQGQSAVFKSMDYRIKRGNPLRRSKFRDILKVSLEEVMPNYSEAPIEMVVSRTAGRATEMDKVVCKFLTEATEPLQAFVQPILQHALQAVNFKLSGAPFNLVGNFYRPILSNASIQTCYGDTQLFECVKLNLTKEERRIYALVLDTAIGRKISPEESRVGFTIIDAVSYIDFGPEYWGPSLLANNPRVPITSNPFYNLSMNPTYNRCYNTFTSPTFIPPMSLCGEQKYFPGTALNMNPCAEGNEFDNCADSSGENSYNSKQLNAMAEEFYPAGYEIKDPLAPTTNVKILQVNPPYTGPDEISVSGLMTDTEDFFDLEQDCDGAKQVQVERCSSETQTTIGLAEIVVSAASRESHVSNGINKPELSTRNYVKPNSWSEEVENHARFEKETFNGRHAPVINYSNNSRSDRNDNYARRTDWGRTYSPTRTPDADREQGRPHPWKPKPRGGAYQRWKQNRPPVDQK